MEFTNVNEHVALYINCRTYFRNWNLFGDHRLLSFTMEVKERELKSLLDSSDGNTKLRIDKKRQIENTKYNRNRQTDKKIYK